MIAGKILGPGVRKSSLVHATRQPPHQRPKHRRNHQGRHDSRLRHLFLELIQNKLTKLRVTG